MADILDGALARNLRVDGPLGVQLDSLADIVSFGVLPAFVFYNLGFNPTGSGFENMIHLILSASIAVSAGLRLARFNVDSRPREYFWGLATPAGSIMVIALNWAIHAGSSFLPYESLLHLLKWMAPVFLIIMYQVALKLPGLKSPKSGIWTLIVIAILTGIGFIMFGPIAITLGIFLYVVLGIVNLVFKWY